MFANSKELEIHCQEYVNRDKYTDGRFSMTVVKNGDTVDFIDISPSHPSISRGTHIKLSYLKDTKQVAFSIKSIHSRCASSASNAVLWMKQVLETAYSMNVELIDA